MRVQKIVDDYLLERQRKSQEREKSGKWSPSLFGRCYRLQFYNRKKVKPTNLPTITALRRFRAGDLFHDFIQKLLPEHQTEVKVETESILGFADIVFDNEVADIKSIPAFVMRRMKKRRYDPKEKYNIEEDKFANILQVTSYAYLLHKPQARLIFICKESLDIEEFVFSLAKWQDKVIEELNILDGYWKKDKLPPALPRAYNKEDCKYCIYRDRCKKEEAKKNLDNVIEKVIKEVTDVTSESNDR